MRPLFRIDPVKFNALLGLRFRPALDVLYFIERFSLGALSEATAFDNEHALRRSEKFTRNRQTSGPAADNHQIAIQARPGLNLRKIK